VLERDQEVDLVNTDGAASRWTSQRVYAIGDRMCFYTNRRYVTQVEIVDVEGTGLLGMLQGLPDGRSDARVCAPSLSAQQQIPIARASASPHRAKRVEHQ
jgi:hypothetical protein